MFNFLMTELGAQFMRDVVCNEGTVASPASTLKFDVSPANSTPAPTALAWEVDYTVQLQNSQGEVQKWFNGKVPISIADDAQGTATLEWAIVPDDYECNKTYHRKDLVTYEGSIYEALKDTNGNLPTDTNYWSSAVANPLFLYFEDGEAVVTVAGDAGEGNWANTKVVTLKVGGDTAGTEIFGQPIAQVSRTITFTTP